MLCLQVQGPHSVATRGAIWGHEHTRFCQALLQRARDLCMYANARNSSDALEHNLGHLCIVAFCLQGSAVHIPSQLASAAGGKRGPWKGAQ